MDAATHSSVLNDVLTSAAKSPTATTPAAPASRIGERLRSLRLAAGLTQTQVAGDRFSKEYISQIERGKTRPTAESIAWLATQLGVDPAFLGSGVGATGSAELEVRALSGEAWARAEEGEVRQAVELLLVARELAEGPQFSTVDRADILFRLGVCRYK